MIAQDKIQSPQRSVTAFVIVAFGISWAFELASILLTGTANTEIAGVAIYGPAVAGLLLSRTGRSRELRHFGPRARSVVVSWPLCAGIVFLHAPPQVRDQHPVAVVLVSALGALLPAWVISGAFSVDAGIRDFLRTLIVPRSLLWSLLPGVCFAVFLVAPIPFASLFGGSIFYPNLPESRWRLAEFVIVNFCFAFVAG